MPGRTPRRLWFTVAVALLIALQTTTRLGALETVKETPSRPRSVHQVCVVPRSRSREEPFRQGGKPDLRKRATLLVGTSDSTMGSLCG